MVLLQIKNTLQNTIIKIQYMPFISKKLDLLAIGDEFGYPLYVYDISIIERQYKKLTSTFDVPKLKVNYACKALTNIHILKQIHNLGAGLDAVSIQEVLLGLKSGFLPQEIFYTPNGVSMSEVREVVELGVKINIDNLVILEKFGNEFPEYPVGIRINPHILAGGNAKISVGGINSKFGISFHRISEVKKIIEETGLKMEGVHMHTGSDILDVNAFIFGADVLLNVARQFPDLDYIDFGSGFKVAYKENDVVTDIEYLGKEISTKFNTFIKEYGKEVTLVFEPGKFLVSESGYFLAKVNVVKQTMSNVFAAVDSGFNHLVRPMFYDSYHHVENLSNQSENTKIYTITGYICETDTFASNRQISKISEGDVLVFHNAGAYAYMMASNYNSRYRPAEVMVLNGKAKLIRRRETMEDILRGQINL